jgi:hypothetical protein
MKTIFLPCFGEVHITKSKEALHNYGEGWDVVIGFSCFGGGPSALLIPQICLAGYMQRTGLRTG